MENMLGQNTWCKDRSETKAEILCEGRNARNWIYWKTLIDLLYTRCQDTLKSTEIKRLMGVLDTD